MALFVSRIRKWMVAMARITWGIGVEPKCLTDRTQMCFYIIPGTGGSGELIAGGKQQQSKPRHPSGERGKRTKKQ